MSDDFKKEAKRLIKKYSSLQIELASLFSLLENNPEYGTSLGNNLYKIRIAIASKGKGKSGRARAISFIKVTGQTVLLLTIYDKGKRESISDNEIKVILNKYNA